MTDAPADPGRWSDLRKRVLSAVVMVVVGAAEIWLGGTPMAALVIVLTGVMVWELAAMTAPARRKTPLAMGAVGAVSLLAALVLQSGIAPAFLLVPSLALALTPRRDRRIAAVYAAAIMIAGFGLIELRLAGGITAIIWLILVVVASDVMGYFAGRILGGPKFWPAVSPKKTWSGTVAGWIGAALVGLGFVLTGNGDWVLVPFSALVALAGQLGDIGESWIKRRAGVKDASRLIPGHGGVLDRFDALIGATVVIMLVDLVLPLPVGG